MRSNTTPSFNFSTQDFSRRASPEATLKAKDCHPLWVGWCVGRYVFFFILYHKLFDILKHNDSENKSGFSPLQKAAQLDDESHYLLHDIACLWIWLQPKLAKNFPAPVVEKHEKLFFKGCLFFARYWWLLFYWLEALPSTFTSWPRSPKIFG